MYSLSPEDLRILADPETAALVEKHLNDDPVQLAFRLKCSRERARLVCRQVKYLQRAKTKLPSYYKARCIIPPLSYEQCSSEAAAFAKNDSGRLCIDLTGGLGVDSYAFSRSFEKVITVERDPFLSQVARHNFALLGALNITVENNSAESFLPAYCGPEADLIYIDPARRNEGERVFLLEDCSPDVVALMPLLLEKSKRVLIKLSPLFDVEEALRIFSGHLSKIEIVSVGGEVKELLAELSLLPDKTQIGVNLAGERHFPFTPDAIISSPPEDASFSLEEYSFLLIPDAAFYKGRLAPALLRHYYPELPAVLPASNGFVFAENYPEDFPGRIYRILAREEYRPKHLRKSLKDQGIKRINILRRHFPHKSEEIKQALHIEEGGTFWFAFTEAEGKRLVFRVEPVKK